MRIEGKEILRSVLSVLRKLDTNVPAARMNASMVTSEMYLKTKGRIIPMRLFNTERFKRSFLRRPCSGCGSEEHSLLTEVDTLNEIPQYEYECSVVDHYSLYQSDNRDEIHITLRLKAESFVEDCQYDLDRATSRIYELKKGYATTSDHEGYFDTFLNDVRGVCIEYEIRTIRG